MSEPGLVDSGKVVTAKSYPCGWGPWGAGHIWKFTVWPAHKWLSHLLGQAGLHCQQLPLPLICKLILYFKNSRKFKKVLIQHILHYSNRAHKYALTFNTLQFAYLIPSPSSTTHDLFNISKAAIMQLEIRGGGWSRRPEPKATPMLIMDSNLSSPCNHSPNNVLNDWKSPVCIMDQFPSCVHLYTDKLCGFSHTNLQTHQKWMKGYMYLFILYKQIIEFFSLTAWLGNHIKLKHIYHMSLPIRLHWKRSPYNTP